MAAEKYDCSSLTEDESGTSVTMVDVLEESKELEDEANAVLGGSDDKCCTYVQGALKRQALYACTTCTTADMPPAGICLACSYECHEGHNLVEMYTKRNFRCDCGNEKFPNLNCIFFTNKSKTNPENKYNDNFRGLYCICKRPYPDPEVEEEDEMIQCVICEDWYHGQHLGTSPPVNGNYEEMICPMCMDACDFLWYYAVTCEETKLVKEEKANVDVGTGQQDTQASETSSSAVGNGSDDTDGHKAADDIEQPAGKGSSEKETEADEIASTSVGVGNEETTKVGEGSSVEVKSASGACKLDELKKREMQNQSHATFWSANWRKKLCTCVECLKLYEEKKVSFLTDLQDTVHYYEEHGKNTKGSQYEQGIEALSSMNRVQQVEVMHGYNDMKTELKDFLRSFAEQGKVVREEDISEFFNNMQARKRQRTDAGPHMQYFCR